MNSPTRTVRRHTVQSEVGDPEPEVMRVEDADDQEDEPRRNEETSEDVKEVHE